MERHRHHRDAAGGGPGGSGPGGGSSAARNGTCGQPATATGATSPGSAGDDDDESGERDPPVPKPGGVRGPGSVPSPGSVPCPGSVPSAGSVPKSRDVSKSRDVPNSGNVPNAGTVPSPGGISGPGSVPNPRDVPKSRDVPNSGNVPNTGTVSSPGGISGPGSVPNPRSVSNTRSVLNSGNVPNSGTVPSPGGISGPDSVPNTRSVPTPEGVPTPEDVPTPGGRCGCRCPPAAPPSPSRDRDTPCGLGCRHRPLPEDTGDRRTARRPQRGGDSGRGHRGTLRVARAGVSLLLRLLGALLALLFLLLLLLLGGLRSSYRGGSAGLRRSRQLLAEWLRRQRRHPAVPEGDSEEEVTRLVAMAEVAEEELDPFRVLAVEPTASDAELRRAYRRLAVLVHPDKSRDPRAEAAFKVLRAGWERVSSPERRREYQAKQLAQGELARALGAFLARLQEELRDARDAMGCSRCGGRHRRFQLDRDPRGGRYCGTCGRWHAAEDGDLWAESSLLGLRVTYLACMDGHIYDVTEWAVCQRVAISPDSHRVPYHLSFGARTAAPAGRQRVPPKGSPPSPAALQRFLHRLLQGALGPGGGDGHGGGHGGSSPFPSPPGASPTPPGPSRADTKHRRRKKGRRPPPR